MTTTHFIERLFTNDLTLRGTRIPSTATPIETFRIRIGAVQSELRWMRRGVERKLTMTIPVMRDDCHDGYVVCHAETYGIDGVRYLADAVDFAPTADRAALAVGLTLAYDYTDAVDLRRSDILALASICRHALHAAEGDRQLATMILTDYLQEFGFASEPTEW